MELREKRRDQRVENTLKINSYTYRFSPNYPLSRINVPAARDNPARKFRRYEDEHMLRMAVRMEAGDPFPPIVVCDLAGAEDELATGLHRVIAAQLNDVKEFPAYIIAEPDAYRRAILPVLLNAIEGKAPTNEEVFLTIADIVRQFKGAKAGDLCPLYGVKEDAYLVWHRRQQNNDRARALGVSATFKQLTEKLKQECGRIDNDNIFASIVDVVGFTRTMQGQSGEEFVKEVRRHGKTELTAQRMIDQRRRDFQQEEAKRRNVEVRTPSAISTKYISAVNKLRRFRRNFSIAALQLAGIPESRRLAARDAVSDLRCQLAEVEEALTQLCIVTEKEAQWRTGATLTGNGGQPSAPISPTT